MSLARALDDRGLMYIAGKGFIRSRQGARGLELLAGADVDPVWVPLNTSKSLPEATAQLFAADPQPATAAGVRTWSGHMNSYFGRVREDRPAPELTVNDFLGRVDASTPQRTTLCENCHGAAVLSHACHCKDPETCPYCNGTGMRHGQCHFCAGHGAKPHVIHLLVDGQPIAIDFDLAAEMAAKSDRHSRVSINVIDPALVWRRDEEGLEVWQDSWHDAYDIGCSFDPERTLSQVNAWRDRMVRMIGFTQSDAPVPIRLEHLMGEFAALEALTTLARQTDGCFEIRYASGVMGTGEGGWFVRVWSRTNLDDKAYADWYYLEHAMMNALDKLKAAVAP